MSEQTKPKPLSQEDLASLETHSGLMFSMGEIAIILCVKLADLKKLLAVINSPEYNSFHKGRLAAEGKIRTSIFELAQNGSSPAQTQFLELIEKAKLDDAL
jgi:hypothetical protein